MADPLDLDVIATRVPATTAGTEFVPVSPAERDALVAVVRWAQDAPHHEGCPARTSQGFTVNEEPYRCTCGHDEALKPPVVGRDASGVGKLLAERALDGYPGWQVAATFRRRPDGVLALLELHVSPVLLTGPENDQEHEITAAMLRSVRLSDLRQEAQRAAQSWGSDAAHTVAPELGARPGRAGRDDRPYAVLAARYLELCAESRAPVVELAAETYRSTSTVQNLLTESGRRGLLIRRQGRAGGELTEKARRLLDDRGGD